MHQPNDDQKRRKAEECDRRPMQNFSRLTRSDDPTNSREEESDDKGDKPIHEPVLLIIIHLSLNLETFLTSRGTAPQFIFHLCNFSEESFITPRLCGRSQRLEHAKIFEILRHIFATSIGHFKATYANTMPLLTLFFIWRKNMRPPIREAEIEIQLVHDRKYEFRKLLADPDLFRARICQLHLLSPNINEQSL